MENQLPITLGYWILAIIPLATLLVVLVGLRWSAAEAGAVGFFVAAVIAWLAFQSGFEVIGVATGKGIWDAIFILYVVWPALLLYQVTEQAGAFEVFRLQVQEIAKSRLVLVLAFGWVFASFLQGIAGFGAPIAIVAPLLVGIGVIPVMAVVIPLIGHAWANMFGTLAVGWLATIRVVDLQNPVFTAFSAALLLWIINFSAGLTISWLYGRWRAVVKGLPIVLAVSLIHGGGQLYLTTVNPIISNFIPATIGLAVIYLIQKLPFYQKEDDFETKIFKEEEAGPEEERSEMSVHVAFLPYYALILISLIGLVITPINEFLERFSIGFPFPAVTTGFGVTTAAEEAFGEFAIFTHPGTFLIISSIIGYLVFKKGGHYKDKGLKNIIGGMTSNAVPASVAILGFLILSTIMDHSGMIRILALGIAAVSPPVLYAFLSNFIGVVGAFMTSSNTASNILLAPLQQETAIATVLNPSRIIGAQSAGGALGNAIAPANVVLGTGTAKIVGREGDVLRYTLPWVLLVATLIGIASILLFIFNVVLY